MQKGSSALFNRLDKTQNEDLKKKVSDANVVSIVVVSGKNWFTYTETFIHAYIHAAHSLSLCESSAKTQHVTKKE